MLTILATAADEGGFTLPDDPLGIVIWVILAAVILGAYLAIRRTRQRFREDYIRKLNWEKELRANDPDMKKDEA
ncbi:MAG: hypothetical protein HKN91_16825 [Acidimicrobiia bacterium]|nr:hypothetical protein [Acidimicrobiia bacterium]